MVKIWITTKKTNDNCHDTHDKGEDMAFNVTITFETRPFSALVSLKTRRLSALVNNEKVQDLKSPTLYWTAEMPYATKL